MRIHNDLGIIVDSPFAINIASVTDIHDKHNQLFNFDGIEITR